MQYIEILQSIPQWTLFFLAGVLGAILGSFANVCIVRLPQDKSIIWPGSHCPLCEARLAWWENIPIFSFIILGGKCRHCSKAISVRYLIAEMVCVGLSLFTWWHFFDPLHYLVYFCLLVIPLVIISFIDIEHRIIPDSISISGIFVGLAVNTLLAGPNRYLSYALDSVLGIVVGGGFLFLVAYVYEKLKKQEGLGGGDIKLIAMLGAFFGWKAAIFILMLSSVIGSLFGVILIIMMRKNTKYAIPFGPFLTLAGLIQLYFGNRIINWYTHLFY